MYLKTKSLIWLTSLQWSRIEPAVFEYAWIFFFGGGADFPEVKSDCVYFADSFLHIIQLILY